jgi:hypothetical protein
VALSEQDTRYHEVGELARQNLKVLRTSRPARWQVGRLEWQHDRYPARAILVVGVTRDPAITDQDSQAPSAASQFSAPCERTNMIDIITRLNASEPMST